jgi:hypothetical protein
MDVLCVVVSVINNSSDVTTCFRSPSQPVVWNIPADGSAGCPDGATRGVNRV